MSEGWTRGPERSDVMRQHPDLISFAELTETEKEYDRATARETLRAILALGYRILPIPRMRLDRRSSCERKAGQARVKEPSTTSSMSAPLILGAMKCLPFLKLP
jgi:RyR domain